MVLFSCREGLLPFEDKLTETPDDLNVTTGGDSELPQLILQPRHAAGGILRLHMRMVFPGLKV
jgi:hypothetical protein